MAAYTDVMSVSPAAAAAHLRRRAAARQAAIAERAHRLRERLPVAAALLRERHGVELIWLIGSLARGRVHLESDVDLAVSGRIRDYFAALVELEECFGAPVDLIELDTAADSMVARVQREGIAL